MHVNFYADITANYRRMLQEFLAKRGLRNPQYSTGVGYGGRLVCTVTLTDPSSGVDVEFEGQGHANKKSAVQSAAKQGYTCLTSGDMNHNSVSQGMVVPCI